MFTYSFVLNHTGFGPLSRIISTIPVIETLAKSISGDLEKSSSKFYNYRIFSMIFIIIRHSIKLILNIEYFFMIY